MFFQIKYIPKESEIGVLKQTTLCWHLLIEGIRYLIIVILLFVILCTFIFLHNNKTMVWEMLTWKETKLNIWIPLLKKFGMRMPKNIHVYV